MKKTIFILFLFLLSGSLLISCFSDEDSKSSIDYKKINSSTLCKNEELYKWLNTHQHKTGLFTKKTDDATYLLIIDDKKDSNEYSIKLNKLYKDEDYIYTNYSVVSSNKDLYFSGFTNPYLILEIDNSINFKRIIKLKG